MAASRRQRPVTFGEFLINSPFLCVAVIAGLAFTAIALNLSDDPFVVRTWQVLGFGFHFSANQLSRILPDLAGGLDTLMVVGLGLLPYLLLDELWRRIRSR